MLLFTIENSHDLFVNSEFPVSRLELCKYRFERTLALGLEIAYASVCSSEEF